MLLLLVAGCRQKAASEIDFGDFNNSVYTNSYFGMTVSFPTDWKIQDQAEQRRLMKFGGKLMSGDDKNLNAVVKASELQSVNLFAVFQYAPGSPVDFNPSVLAIAEDVRHAPGITRGKDYLFHTRKMLEAGQIQVNFPNEPYTEKLGGTDFDVLDAEISVRSITVKQKYYSAIMKGYAMCFVASFNTPEQGAALKKILDTTEFK